MEKVAARAAFCSAKSGARGYAQISSLTSSKSASLSESAQTLLAKKHLSGGGTSILWACRQYNLCTGSKNIHHERNCPFPKRPFMPKFFQARSAHALTPPRDARAQPTRPRQREARDPGAGGGGEGESEGAARARPGQHGRTQGARQAAQAVLSSVRAHCSALLALGQWGDATSQRSRSRSPCTPRSGGAAAS